MWVSLFVVVDTAILSAWTLDDPLVWRRSVTIRDGYGHPLDSYATCESEKGHSSWYIVLLAVLHIGLLLYGSYLCWTVRKVSMRFQEGKWITFCIVSRLQFIILAVPVLTSIDNDRNTFYIVIAGILFLADGVLIGAVFIPKVYALMKWVDNEKKGIKNPSFSTTKTTNVGMTYTNSKMTSYQTGSNDSRKSPTSSSLVMVAPGASLELHSKSTSSSHEEVARGTTGVV